MFKIWSPFGVSLHNFFLFVTCILILTFQLTGLGLLVLGILSKYAFSYMLKLSTDINYNLAPYIMIACGVFIVLVGFIGCWAANKEHAWALRMVSRYLPKFDFIQSLNKQTYIPLHKYHLFCTAVLAYLISYQLLICILHYDLSLEN